MKDGPVNSLPDFVQACSMATAVYVYPQALEGAKNDFGLCSKKRILEFIADGGLEQPSHANTADWENNPDPSTVIKVDSYNFFSGTKYGYVAFLLNHVTKKWIIKSFKKNTETDPRFFTLAAAFTRAQLPK